MTSFNIGDRVLVGDPREVEWWAYGATGTVSGVYKESCNVVFDSPIIAASGTLRPSWIIDFDFLTLDNLSETEILESYSID